MGGEFPLDKVIREGFIEKTETWEWEGDHQIENEDRTW